MTKRWIVSIEDNLTDIIEADTMEISPSGVLVAFGAGESPIAAWACGRWLSFRPHMPNSEAIAA